jgi:CubicO group peptidase (beta-lactamase class C family)
VPVAVDELRARLTQELRRLAAEHEVPGASVAVLIGDDVVEATCGVINTRTGEPVTPDTLFMIQSITKVITATLVLQLVDDQLAGLDDLVSDHLPGFRTADPEAGARVTVRHLLTHTGGFEGDLWAATTSGEDALQRFVENLVRHAPQHSAPGDRFSYCNAGFGVLGRLIEVQRGMTYEQALRRYLTEPLGVDEVAFSADQALAFRTAIGHVRPEPGAAQRPLANWAVLPPSNPSAGTSWRCPPAGCSSSPGCIWRRGVPAKAAQCCPQRRPGGCGSDRWATRRCPDRPAVTGWVGGWNAVNWSNTPVATSAWRPFCGWLRDTGWLPWC